MVCDPKELSKGELERVSRRYIDAIFDFIGPDKDIPAPDVYTNPQVMAWMVDEFSKNLGYNSPAVITGKPVGLGGSLGRGDATGRGIVFTIREATRELGISPDSATIAVQGFGNVGYHAARLVRELLHCRVVAVSDVSGGIYDSSGLDLKPLKRYEEKHGSVAGYGEGEKISNEELLSLDVDVLIPAAVENVITEENAGSVQATLIAEGANGPTTPDADEILIDKGIYIIPDFLCNAGGVTVSYFEWVQNRNRYYWSEDEVYERLDKKMTKAFRQVRSRAEQEGVDNRTAAYMVAVERVAETMKLRGWV